MYMTIEINKKQLGNKHLTIWSHADHSVQRLTKSEPFEWQDWTVLLCSMLKPRKFLSKVTLK